MRARRRPSAHAGRGPAAAAVLAAGLSAAAGCAHGPCSPEPSGWRVARTPHFLIYSDAWEPRIDSLATFLERWHFALTRAFFPGAADARDIEVLLFADEGDLIDHVGYLRPAMSFRSGGSGPRRQGLSVFSAEFQEGQVAHHVAHRLLHLAAPGAPFWLHEAVAGHAQSGFVLAGPPADTMMRGALVPLADLWRAGWEEFDGDWRGRYRNTAWTLLTYLLNADRGAHRGGFAVFFTGLLQGAPPPDALAAAYPSVTPEILQDRMEGWARMSYPDTLLSFYVVPAFRGSLVRSIAPADPGDMKGLCACLRQLGEPRRETWPDWL